MVPIPRIRGETLKVAGPRGPGGFVSVSVPLDAARAKGVEDAIRFLLTAFLRFFLRLRERYRFVLCLGLRLVCYVSLPQFLDSTRTTKRLS